MTAWPSSVPPAGVAAPAEDGLVEAVTLPERRLHPGLVSISDVGAALVATALAVRLRFGSEVPVLRIGEVAVGYGLVAAVAAATWATVLAASGAYKWCVVWAGPSDLRRLLRAGLTLFACLAAYQTFLGTDVSTWLVVVLVLLTVLFSLMVRLVVDRVALGDPGLGSARRMVVYGSDVDTRLLTRYLDDAGCGGLEVVGACIADGGTVDPVSGLPFMSSPPRDEVLQLISRTGADSLAVTGSTPPDRLRWLVWALEGSGVDVLVAPVGAVEQRVTVRPVGNLPLLQVEGSRLTGGRLLLKEVVDRVGAALFLLALAPVMLAVAAAVRATSRGPILYRQERVGRDGRIFACLKFRTMILDADAQTARLRAMNVGEGLLFKVHDDPRVTPVGRFLRRWSLDELPQFWNVLRGDMSLVGPRPLPVSPDDFQGDARRRLRTKPGITGLWQISGRSDLGWEESVRLDVRYVDHWSLALDLSILLRTPAAVLRGRGAY